MHTISFNCSSDWFFSTLLPEPDTETIMSDPANESNPPAQCVGPEYRPEAEKPTATVSSQVSYDNVHILPQTPQLIALLTCVLSLINTLG